MGICVVYFDQQTGAFAGQNHPFQHLTSFSIKMKKKVKTSKNKINTQNGVHQGVHMKHQILPYNLQMLFKNMC